MKRQGEQPVRIMLSSKVSNAAGTFPESGVKYNSQNGSLQGRGTWDIHSEYVQKITMIIS